jgi:hypothetical protein
MQNVFFTVAPPRVQGHGSRSAARQSSAPVDSQDGGMPVAPVGARAAWILGTPPVTGKR